MPTFAIDKSNIALWKGAEGSFQLTLDAALDAVVLPGANPILSSHLQIEGRQPIALGSSGSPSIGVDAGTDVRLVPIFSESVSEAAADLVKRFSLGESLRPDNLLLVLEVGGQADLSARGTFRYGLLGATTELKAGTEATYVAVRSFPRTATLKSMLLDLAGHLKLPGRVIEPPAPGEVVSLEFGGTLSFKVGASAGYEVKGTESVDVSQIALSEHYALSAIGKLTFSGGIAGRFSVEVSAGSEPGFARVVVRRRREQELQFAADVKVAAALDSQGLPASGKEFLGALLGIEAKNWLNLADTLVTEAGKIDSIETLKAKLDGLAMDYLGSLAGKALDEITTKADVQAFQTRLGRVVASYRKLDGHAIALFDRYFDPVVNRLPDLMARLEELRALTSWDRLQGEVDPLLWNAVRQLTDGDPLGWALGLIPGTGIPSLPALKTRVDDALSLIRDSAHQELRDAIALTKEQFGLDSFFNQLGAISTPEGLKALATQKLGHFITRLIGAAVDDLNGNDLKTALQTVKAVATARDHFFETFDRVLAEAAAQNCSLSLHAAYREASESQALIDMEIKLREPDGTANATGLRYMEAAGRGDFQEALARFQPGVVNLRSGLLTHKATASSTLTFNVAGWHKDANYKAMYRLILDTRQQIRDTGNGLLTVFTTIDMKADSERRRRGSKGEEAVMTNFLLRFLAESKLSDSTFDGPTQQYALDVITRMSAAYSVTFTDEDTSVPELDDYLQFARQLGLDEAGATRAGLDPVLELRNGSLGKTESSYEVRYTEEGVRALTTMQPSADDVRQILRRIVLSNYFSHPTLHDVGWLYASDDVRQLFEKDPIGFAGSEGVLRNAEIRIVSPIPGLLPPKRFESSVLIRNDVATLFNIEAQILRALDELGKLLRSPIRIKTADLQKRLKTFGDVLHAFDGFDMGENSIFAVFDGLVQLAAEGTVPRSSVLTFTSTAGGAPRTKVFSLAARKSPAQTGRPAAPVVRSRSLSARGVRPPQRRLTRRASRSRIRS